MKFLKKILPKISAALVVTVLLMLLLLDLPQPFFHASVSAKNLTLYSDRPFNPVAGQKLLSLVESRIARSPLYVAEQKHLIFICNARWRQRLFFTYNYGAGGVNYYPITNVFLRDAIVEENCLIGPSGYRVSSERTLDYFIAHEITHTLTGQAIGAIAYHRLPRWKREGYADYVGKGEAFDYATARRAFLAGDPQMDWAKSGLYWRYHLLVAQLLDKQHWSVHRLLDEPIQEQEVEASIRAER